MLISTSLSKSALRKLTKDEAIALTLECQGKFDNTLSNINEELSELRNDFIKIESELSISKHVYIKLHERVVALERQCWGISKYSRRECLKITGVPDSIRIDDLEETTLKIFDKLDVAIDSSNIEDCHWLKRKKVIIKFARRKDANHIRKNKNKLKGMNLCSTGVNNPVFINSLCSYHKMLWRTCKKLWSNKYIHAFWVSYGILRLKLTVSGRVHVITHSQGLDENELLWYKQYIPFLFVLFNFT